MSDNFPADADSEIQLNLFTQMQRLSWILTIAGVLPFAITALAAFAMGADNPLTVSVVEVFRTWSVVVLSFLGGIRWGHALVYHSDRIGKAALVSLVASVLPALFAWSTYFLADRQALVVLILAYAAQGAWDSLTAQTGNLPRWFASQRIILTLAVVACHMFIFMMAV
jgi:hypothetical protein